MEVDQALATTGICTTGSVQTITITGGGSGYTSAPIVTITGSGATTATYNQFDSTFKTFDSTQHEFDDDRVFNPQLVGATGVSTISSAGIVTGAYIINAGCGYTEVPEVTFANHLLLDLEPQSVSEHLHSTRSLLVNQ